MAKFLHKHRPLRAWPHQTHLAFEHVPQLWQFIQTRAPQQRTQTRAPWVVLLRPHLARVLLGMLVHGAKLDHAQNAAVVPHALLRIQHRSPRRRFDEHGDHREHRQADHEQRNGDGQIEQALAHLIPAIHRRAAEGDDGVSIKLFHTALQNNVLIEIRHDVDVHHLGAQLLQNLFQRGHRGERQRNENLIDVSRLHKCLDVIDVPKHLHPVQLLSHFISVAGQKTHDIQPELRVASNVLVQGLSEFIGAQDQDMAQVVATPAGKPEQFPEDQPRADQTRIAKKPKIAKEETRDRLLLTDVSHHHQEPNRHGGRLEHLICLRQMAADAAWAVHMHGFKDQPPNERHKPAQKEILLQGRNAVVHRDRPAAETQAIGGKPGGINHGEIEEKQEVFEKLTMLFEHPGTVLL